MIENKISNDSEAEHRPGGNPGRNVWHSGGIFLLFPIFILLAFFMSSCRSATSQREAADRAAYELIGEAGERALGRCEPFTVERPSVTFRQRLLIDQRLPVAEWGDLEARIAEVSGSSSAEELGFLADSEDAVDVDVRISLLEALQLGAANGREYQTRKESVFSAALQLDLEQFRFDNTFSGAMEAVLDSDQASGVTTGRRTGELGFSRAFQTGAALGARLVVDLVSLLHGERSSAFGILADGSVSIPLLRGSGPLVVAEAKTQAERDLVYAIHQFERFKQSFAVRVAGEYFSVLQRQDQIDNAQASLERLELLVERTEALFENGRVTGIQVDQARQDLLRARERWITARENYERENDRFKITLGLPPDARLAPRPDELENLLATLADGWGGGGGDEPGWLEIAESRAMEVALRNRLDLRTALAEAEDARRGVLVAADALQPGLNVGGGVTAGERRSGAGGAADADARIDFSDASYRGDLSLDAPWSRRSERNAYRRSQVRLEAALRAAREAEDSVKLEVRDGLRDLLRQREQYRIQAQALEIAERRVRQAQAFQEVGRAETRDVLEANEALLSAQNAVTDAMIRYRLTELSFQRDLGVLQVDHRGLWTEVESAALVSPTT